MATFRPSDWASGCAASVGAWCELLTVAGFDWLESRTFDQVGLSIVSRKSLKVDRRIWWIVVCSYRYFACIARVTHGGYPPYPPIHQEENGHA
jgi:hypothetical protein